MNKVMIFDKKNLNKNTYKYKGIISDFKNWNDFETNLLLRIKNNQDIKLTILVFEKDNLNQGIFNRKNIIEKMKSFENEIDVTFIDLDYLSFENIDLNTFLKDKVNIDQVLIPSNYYDEDYALDFKYFLNFWQENLIEFCNYATKNNNELAISHLRNSDFDLFYDIYAQNYAFTGFVTHGKALGRTIGFPTANLVVRLEKVLPQATYAVKVLLEDENQEFFGMACYWVNENNESLVEVNILDFNKDIYGKRLDIIPVQKLRDNKKVNGIDELITMLKRDQENVEELFK